MRTPIDTRADTPSQQTSGDGLERPLPLQVVPRDIVEDTTVPPDFILVHLRDFEVLGVGAIPRAWTCSIIGRSASV